MKRGGREGGREGGRGGGGGGGGSPSILILGPTACILAILLARQVRTKIVPNFLNFLSYSFIYSFIYLFIYF